MYVRDDEEAEGVVVLVLIATVLEFERVEMTEARKAVFVGEV